MDAFDKQLLAMNGFTTEARMNLRTHVLLTLRGRGNGKLWAELWHLTDAYGVPGYLPAQGYDWSGFRDSTFPAIAKMAEALRAMGKMPTPETVSAFVRSEEVTL